MPMLVVAPMTVADLNAAMLIERCSFKQPWTRHMYLMDLTQNELATYRVIRPPESGVQNPKSQILPSVLAYGGFWLMVDEAHVATIATHPDWRGCGLGTWLMLALLDAAIARGAVRSTLEVRRGNRIARQLYEKLGYEIVGVRRRYYQDGEDALLMTTPPLADRPMQKRLAAVRSAVIEQMEKCFNIQQS